MNLKNNIAISDSGFIFNPSRGESYSTNQSAKELLNLIKENRCKDEIKEYFLNTYEVSSDQFETDYSDFIFSLDQFNLIDHE
jgi:hypothetical protein